MSRSLQQVGRACSVIPPVISRLLMPENSHPIVDLRHVPADAAKTGDW